MHYDAGFLTASVIQSDDLHTDKPLTGELVKDGLENAHDGEAVQGASGELSLGVDDDGWPYLKALSIVTIPQPKPSPKP